MKKLIAYTLVVSMMLFMVGCSTSASPSEPAVEVGESFKLVEADGREVILDKMPERVVVNSFGTAVVMDALGIELVGMTETTRDLPEGLQGLPSIGNPNNPNFETILSLGADLVITTSSFKAMQLEQFEQYGISVYFIDNQMYNHTLESIEILGKAFGKNERASELINDLASREEAVMKGIKDLESPSVMIIFGTPDSFQMATANSYPGNMVKMLNGTNVIEIAGMGNVPSPYLPLSLEQAVELNPQVILRISHGNPQEVKQIFEREFANNPVWSEIDAVKNHRVHDLSNQLFFANPGMEVIEALELLVALLYQ